MPGSAIVFDSVSFTRPRGVEVLDRFSLAIASGSVVALVGRSGAGKSTILKLVNRLLVPDSGSVRVEERDTRQWDPIRLRRRIGYVMQDVGLFPHMTLAENVAHGPAARGLAAGAHRARACASSWGWSVFRPSDSRRDGPTSSRVASASGWASPGRSPLDPPILLMDEPFGALDPITRTELHDEFRRIQARVGKTVMIVTHDMAEALALADRIGVIDGGVLVAFESSRRCASSSDPRVRRLLDRLSTGSAELTAPCTNCSRSGVRIAPRWPALLAQHVAARRDGNGHCGRHRRAARDLRRPPAPAVVADRRRSRTSCRRSRASRCSASCFRVPLVGGVGARAALVVLVLYGLLPIVRTTIAGLQRRSTARCGKPASRWA